MTAKTKDSIHTQATKFVRVRSAHQSETAEDYVELIAELIAATGEARLMDIARRLGVSHVTANKVIARLGKEGLVISEPYRPIFLTKKGQVLADKCKKRHKIISDFLIKLGVDPVTADSDAEGIEHHVSDATLKKFEAFLK